MRVLGTFFILLFSVNGLTQSSEINAGAVSSEILRLVNAYRDSIGVRKLKNNSILEAAAQDQADYNNWNNTLSHDQITYNKQTPSERVFYYGGNFNYIGENVAFVSTLLPNKKAKSAIELATDLFTSWMNSPPHKENISRANYYLSGIALSYNKKTNQLYGTQVFSALGYNFKAAHTTPAKAYGVQGYNEKSCESMKNFRYGTLSFANGIYTRGDSIFIKYHNKSYFDRVINGANDGYAIDIVFRDQLPCNSPNRFHGSNIFDGYMLPPVFRYELLRENQSENPKKLATYLGLLPKGLPQHELNLILIRDNKKCDYSYPVQVPYEDIPPFYIEPVWLSQEANFTPFSIDTTITIHFSFLRSSTNFYRSDYMEQVYLINKYAPFVKKIEIQTYSSIEGKEWYNKRLQEERAAKIEAAFSGIGLTKRNLFKTTAKENWEKFETQKKEMKLTEFDKMNTLDVKRYLKINNKNGKYDSLLFEQRRSVATIKIKGRVDALNDDDKLAIAWDRALKEHNIEMAAMILQKVIENDVSSPYLFTNDARIDSSYYENLTFATNLLALKIKTKSQRLPKNVENTKILSLPLTNIEENYYAINWINLYYHNLYRISRQYFSNPTKDKPTIMPEKVFTILEKIKPNYFPDSSYIDRIKLNHSLAAIHYYAWVNNYSLVDSHFNNIFTYFFKIDLPIKQATDLALYANMFHKFDKSVKMLASYFDKNQLDENAAFVLAQTATSIQKELDPNNYFEYMKKAYAFNPKRWCKWLNTNFQVLRNETVKQMYCEVCL